MKKMLICMLIGLTVLSGCKGKAEKLPLYSDPVVTQAPTAEAGGNAQELTAQATVAPTTEPSPTPVGVEIPNPNNTQAPQEGQGQEGTTEVVPTSEPSAEPTTVPTVAPTAKPTAKPTTAPTAKPTVAPTQAPVIQPTVAPTVAPTQAPVVQPTAAPTVAPTTPPTTVCTDHTYVYSRTISEADCICPKEVEEKCSVCGATRTCNEGEALGHNFEGYYVWREPTCSFDGLAGGICTRCGTKEGHFTQKAPHDYQETVILEGDCNGNPHVVRYDCKNCGSTYKTTDTEYHRNDHTWVTGTGRVFNEETWEWDEVTITKCSVCNRRLEEVTQ